MKYQDFLADLRTAILEQARHSEALDQLFAELVSQAHRQGDLARISEQRWSSLKARHTGLMSAFARWQEELSNLNSELLPDASPEPSSLTENPLSDPTEDPTIADVDLEALEALEAAPASMDDEPGYVWPDGSAELDRSMSALDALSADLDERSDPWSALHIRDLRETGSPSPLDAHDLQTRTLLEGPTSPVRTLAPSPPAPTPPPMPTLRPDSEPRHAAATHSFETLTSVQGLASLAVKLILRAGKTIHTGFSTGIGVEYLSLALEHHLQAGQVVHVFFELPNGSQVGVNGVVTDVNASTDGGAPYGVLIRYLDLTDEGADILNEVIATY